MMIVKNEKTTSTSDLIDYKISLLEELNILRIEHSELKDKHSELQDHCIELYDFICVLRSRITDLEEPLNLKKDVQTNKKHTVKLQISK
jgi:uncharacterized membrane protein